MPLELPSFKTTMNTSTNKIDPVYGRVHKYNFFKVCSKTYRESFLRINFYHASEQVLTIGRYKVGYVKVAPFDFFQKLPEIVIVERKGSNQQGIQNHTARPHICPSAIVLLPLEKKVDILGPSIIRTVSS